jgi:tetratricopeptide (TPR) repeat protein
MRLILILMALASPLAAQDICPPVPDHQAVKANLLSDLAESENALVAASISAMLWRLWTIAPDDVAQAMLDDGMARIQAGDFGGAIAALDPLTVYCPDYAEGWNQRAYAAFLMADFAAALEDLDRALAIDPSHVPALAGKALTLFGLGRDQDGRDVLRAALALNPWLRERALLGEPGGTDL